jgi:hypothetical protein
MPQPIRRQLSLPLKFEKEALEQRPSLARYIAQVSAAWTDLECSVGLLLAIILDTEAKTGVHMYLALSGSAAQVHVLTGAAEAKLSQALQDELSELLKEQRNRAAERNRIVHALWATAPEYPDGIINCPPDNFVRDKFVHAGTPAHHSGRRYSSAIERVYGKRVGLPGERFSRRYSPD